ncbi:hypothetical protein SAZ11_50675 [Streptomyces sp. FXJ1.4098]|nr:hypothetical protein [Streptomyces sp. FXJ1.4098]
MELSRRSLIQQSGKVAVGAGALWLGGPLAGLATETAAAQGKAAEGDTRQITVGQATNASAALSPDGRTIVMDLFNLLWTLPAQGGEATRLTDIDQEASEPDFSPDGRHLVYQSYADGNFHLWLARADGSEARRLTEGDIDHHEPRFSPDGKRIAYAAETDGHYAIHVLDLDTGESKRWTSGTDATVQEAQPFWRPDGKAIVFTSGKGDAPQSVVQVDADGKRNTLVTVTEGRVAGPSLSPTVQSWRMSTSPPRPPASSSTGRSSPATVRRSSRSPRAGPPTARCSTRPTERSAGGRSPVARSRTSPSPSISPCRASPSGPPPGTSTPPRRARSGASSGRVCRPTANRSPSPRSATSGSAASVPRPRPWCPTETSTATPPGTPTDPPWCMSATGAAMRPICSSTTSTAARTGG